LKLPVTRSPVLDAGRVSRLRIDVDSTLRRTGRWS
jgi:hypothetical protein